MIKKLIFTLPLFLIVFFSSFLNPIRVNAVKRANCDLCGYCVNYNPYTQTDVTIKDSLEQKWTQEGKNEQEQNNLWAEWVESWKKCQRCLYPALGNLNNPLSNETLNGVPTPFPNRAYTMLGCLAVPGSNPDGSFDYVSMALFVNQITGFLLNIAAGAAFLFLIYGSATVLTSQTDPERLNEGKRTIYGAVIGLILALLSNFFLNFIANNILKIPGFG